MVLNPQEGYQEQLRQILWMEKWIRKMQSVDCRTDEEMKVEVADSQKEGTDIADKVKWV